MKMELLTASPEALGWQSQVCKDRPQLPQELLLGGGKCSDCGTPELDPAGSLLWVPFSSCYYLRSVVLTLKVHSPKEGVERSLRALYTAENPRPPGSTSTAKPQ